MALSVKSQYVYYLTCFTSVLPTLYMDATVVNGHACLNLDPNLPVICRASIPHVMLSPMSADFCLGYLPIIHYVQGIYFQSGRTVICLFDQNPDLKPYPLASLLRCRCLSLFLALVDYHYLRACLAPNNL